MPICTVLPTKKMTTIQGISHGCLTLMRQGSPESVPNSASSDNTRYNANELPDVFEEELDDTSQGLKIIQN